MVKQWQNWLDFTLALTSREIKGRYKHAALGFLWIVANPLLQMLVIGLVFQFIPGFRTENYFLYLFLGLLPWSFFTTSFSKATPLFVYERYLIKKAAFPRESLVISLILSNLLHLSIGLLLVLPFTGFSVNAVLLAAAVSWLFFFTAGISLLFSSLNVKFRDVDFFTKALLPLWFYTTPIIYSPEILPHQLQQLLVLNPMTLIIQLFRAAFGVPETFSFGQSLLIPLSLTLVVVVLGLLVFKKEEQYFDDWM
ncbi:MAG: Polysaccharide ABC transporter, permease component [Candidatus Pacebacteria bacterium GW2011_GWA1_46_10]|nr:MAG: Polysaccharide ABC transporter, permease component [Candidatus Pacebacteria bacterium GW2011_GWA1_46_10]HCR80988.1 hypothetical protein [Candidatus Paceibacterota bacterium]